ncbi:Nipped-B-like protein [Hondaea fermentalgiana]|uniref:Sister chromatid cohesion protein n=1 Tax=Hondaea fermentalgiana TaxID=2315210 RepID=A0A2R5FZ68_9STRA|nr:Nipped-B-like protein [Hondaea fermentalgiana]|eukprot:GBG24047.1 Nipped-B-like protein [Hondaea fermentalgiana]
MGAAQDAYEFENQNQEWTGQSLVAAAPLSSLNGVPGAQSREAIEAKRVSDVLDSVLQTLDEAAAERLRGNEAVALGTSDEMPNLESVQVDLNAICKDLEAVMVAGALSHVDAETLVSFAQALCKTAAAATATNELAEALDRASLLLRIMADPHADPRLVSGESLEAAINLCRMALIDVLYPQIDANFSAKAGMRAKSRSNSNVSSRKKRGAAKRKGRKNGRKRRRGERPDEDGGEGGQDADSIRDDDDDLDSPRSASNDGQESPELDATAQGLDADSSTTGTDLRLIADAAARALASLDGALARIPRIEDAQLVQVISLCTACLYLDPVKKKTSLVAKAPFLQQVSLDLLRSIFRHNVAHRSLVLDELSDAVSRLPRSSRNLRTYCIPGRDRSTVQLLTVAVLEIVQSACGPDPSEPQAIPDFRVAQQSAYEFLRSILDKCASPQDHIDEEEVKHHRNFLNYFVEDLLQLLHEPRWPAAEMMLSLVSNFITNYLLKPAKTLTLSAQRFGMQSLTLLGSVLARIQQDQLWAAENPLKLPSEASTQTTRPQDVRSLCPICGIADTGDEEMAGTANNQVQCERCKQCFHVGCLGMQDSFAMYHCDDCIMVQQLEAVGTCVAYAFDARSATMLGSTAGPAAADLAAFRQLYLNILTSEHLDGSRGASMAYEFCVAQWAQEDMKPGGIGETSRGALLSQWKYRDALANLLGGARTTRSRNSVSRFTAAALVRHLDLVRAHGLCSKATGDTMLTRLLRILGTGVPSLRARAVKAVGVVIEANPALMEDKRVQAVVEKRVLDEAISVREATIDLVGRYVVVKPALVKDFQAMLVQRLSDLGLSVRKRVVKVLRSLLLASAPFPDRAAVLMALVDRVADPQEEDSVRDLIISIFRDLWFAGTAIAASGSYLEGSGVDADAAATAAASTPAHGRRNGSVPGSATSANENGGEEDRSRDASPGMTPFRTPMQAVHSARRQRAANSTAMRSMATPGIAAAVSATSNGASIPFTDLSEEEQTRALQRNSKDIMTLAGIRADNNWLVALLKGILDPSDVKSARETDRARATCERLVATMVSQLLDIQGEDYDMGEVKEDGNVFVNNDPEELTMYILRALGLFADAAPQLLMGHLESLASYLLDGMLQVKKEDEVEAACTILRIATQSLRTANKRPEARFAEGLAKQLRALILRRPPQVMEAAAETLGVLCTHDKRLEEYLRAPLNQFDRYLDTLQNIDTLKGKDMRTMFGAHRAMLGSGAICRALQDPENRLLDNAVRHILHHAQDEQHKRTRVIAMQALGHICIKDPQRLLSEQADSFVAHALERDPDSAVRCQALATLQHLLQLGEERLEDGQAQASLELSTSRADRVKGDQDTDSGVVASVMQKHAQAIIGLLFDKSAKVRIHAVLLVGTMLRQGLINPLQCIEPMVTLESDEKWVVHDTAHQFLVDLDERHPEFLVTRCVQGLIQAYRYKQDSGYSTAATVPRDSVEDDAGADPDAEKHFRVGPLQPTFSIFSRLYRSCLAGNVAHRTRFMQSALSLFRPDPSLFTDLTSSLSSPTNKGSSSSSTPAATQSRQVALGELQFVAETLGTLPYTLWEEPLYLVYQINSLTSLHGDALVQLLKPSLAPELTEESGAHTAEAEANGEASDDPTPKLSKLEYGKLDAEPLRKAYAAVEALQMLFKLKAYLKSTYNLSEARCEKYNPNETAKATEKHISSPPTSLPPFPEINSAIVTIVECKSHEIPTTQELVEMLRNPFHAFVDALTDDPDDVAYVPESKSGSSKKRRRSSATAQAPPTEPEGPEAGIAAVVAAPAATATFDDLAAGAGVSLQGVQADAFAPPPFDPSQQNLQPQRQPHPHQGMHQGYGQMPMMQNQFAQVPPFPPPHLQQHHQLQQQQHYHNAQQAAFYAAQQEQEHQQPFAPHQQNMYPMGQTGWDAQGLTAQHAAMMQAQSGYPYYQTQAPSYPPR